MHVQYIYQIISQILTIRKHTYFHYEPFFWFDLLNCFNHYYVYIALKYDQSKIYTYTGYTGT